MKSEKVKRNNKRNFLIVMSLLIISFIVIGVSYAIWQITLTQTDKNTVTTSCFKIEFQDDNPINLEKSYPILNEEGKKLIPYTFTIENTCDTYASYQINLEILNTSTLINLDTIRVLLNETNFEKDSSLLESYDVVESTLSNATTSHKLETGYLNKEEEKTFELRLWLDESTPPDEAYMNKVLESKVTIITSYLNESPTYAEVITNCSNNGYKTTICMLENSNYDTTNLAYDETVDNNLRYIGANPNNYVDFNNEKWRIIGVMNNVSDGDGVLASRIKLIRDESIGEYSWDTSPSNINSGWGINEWSEADIMKLLNPGYESESVGGSLYWNRASGNCYIGANNATTSCDFTTKGLLDESKQIIEKIVWHTGSNGSVIAYNNILTSKFYELERSNNTGKICTNNIYCNDTISRDTIWMGLIGLMHPSDYGYATGGESEESRKECLNIVAYEFGNAPQNKCNKNNWLYDNNESKWTMNPANLNNQGNVVYHIYMQGVNASNAFYSYNIIPHVTQPVLYLKSNIKITSGDGTKENSYQLSIE